MTVEDLGPVLHTIPTTDAAFREHVERVAARDRPGQAAELEGLLHRLFPRVRVRERSLSGERVAWYIYRDGGWVPPDDAPWWDQRGIPRVTLAADGWLAEANVPALSLLGVTDGLAEPSHFSDFIAPGALDDAQQLLSIIATGRELTATLLFRPIGGEVLAADVRAAREGDALVVLFRLADDIEAAGPPLPRPTEVSTHPSADVAFRSYTELLLSRMPAPTAEGLALRLRRLYPHALVQPTDSRWVILRDGSVVDGPVDGWWLDAGLPHVRYDLDGLILDADPAARQLLGDDIVGRHWQDLTTPGGAPRVAEFLAIIERLGTVISRFRMPSVSGALVEFDSFTQVEGSSIVTIMRPLPREAPDTMSA